MEKLTVSSGKRKVNLVKSAHLVGLRTKKPNDLNAKAYVKEEVYRGLGGFNVVALERGGRTVDSRLDEVRSYDEVEVGTHVYYIEGSNRPMVPTGEIYIHFADGTSEEEQKVALDELKLELVERRSAEFVIARVTESSPNPLKAASKLEQSALVRRAEPDLDALVDEYAFIAPEDDLLDHQWHLKNPGFVVDRNWRMKKGADAKIIEAWEKIGGTGSSKVTIAVIDNGIDITHPDLRSKVYKPWDLWNNSSTLNMGDPRFTHGTPCASVAVADSNGRGIVGAAPSSRLMPISGTSYSLRITENMFDYAVKNGADIISCSWGVTDPVYDLSPAKEEAIAKAAREGRNGKGCIILFAAGNEAVDYINFYAAHPDVIAIAASTSKDEHAPYSNRGREVSVCAPSNGDWPIIAARAWWDEGHSQETGIYKYWRDGKDRGQNYKHFGGTSSSTPLVAGICALILSVNPDLTAKEVKSILERTADKIGNPSDYDSRGHSRKFGYGRVNALRAVSEAMRMKDASTGVTETTDPPVEPVVSSGQGLFRFSVKQQPSEGFGVQIGAFAEYGNVLIQAEKLERLFGEPVIVNINELEGRTVYKIVVGAFNDASKARTLLERMQQKEINGFVRDLSTLK